GSVAGRFWSSRVAGSAALNEGVSSMSRTKWAGLGILAGAALVAGACASGERAWGGTMTDSAGITIVESPAEGLWPAGLGPEITEDLTIGNAEGDPDYQFGQIAGIDVTSDGSIYVLDQQARQVRVFDPAGTFVKTIGGPGQGPGEFSQATMGLLATAGDTILVPDLMLQRLDRFTADGTFISQMPMPMATGGVSVRWAERPDGMLVQEARMMQVPGMMDAEPAIHLLRRHPGGELADTILTLSIPQSFELDTAGGQVRASIRLFESEPVWTLAEDGRILFAMNSAYDITVYSEDGRQQERIIRRTWERKPVTDGDKQAFMKLLTDLWSQQPQVTPQALEFLRNSVSFADYYPAFTNLLGGPGNTIWVQHVQTAADMDEGVEFNPQDMGSPRWDVFDRDGRYLGEVTLPDRYTPLRVIGDRIWGIWRDDLDVQYVKALTVTMPVE
ncbi:MAG: 6-bladed beta-propeller, partial [Gemmatimonadota bacterium]